MGAETVVLVLVALSFGAQAQNINWRSNFSPLNSNGCPEIDVFETISKSGACNSATILDTRLPNSMKDCEAINGNYGNLRFAANDQKFDCDKEITPCENSYGIGRVGLGITNQKYPLALPEANVCNSKDTLSITGNTFSKFVIGSECAPTCNSISDTLSTKLTNPFFNRFTQSSCEPITETCSSSILCNTLTDCVTRPTASSLNRNNLETCGPPSPKIGTSMNSFQNRIFPLCNTVTEAPIPSTSRVSERPGLFNRPWITGDITSLPCSKGSEITQAPFGTTVSETPCNTFANRPVNSLPCVDVTSNCNTVLNRPIFEAFPVNNLPCVENIQPICNSITEVPKYGVARDTFTSRPFNRVFEAFPSLNPSNTCQSKINPCNMPKSNVNIPNIDNIRQYNNIPKCNTCVEGLGCSCNSVPKCSTCLEGLGCSCSNIRTCTNIPTCNTFSQDLGCSCNSGTSFCNQVTSPQTSNQAPSIISTTIVDNGACNTLANALQLMILKDFVRETQQCGCSNLGCGTLGCGALGCSVGSPCNEILATGPCVLENVQNCVCGDLIDRQCDVPCNGIGDAFGNQGFPDYGFGSPEFNVVNSILNCRGKPLPDMLTTLLGCQFLPDLGLGYPGLPVNPYLPEVVTPGCPCVPELQTCGSDNCGCNLAVPVLQNCGSCGPNLPFIPGLQNDLSCLPLELYDCNSTPYANVPCADNCNLIQAGCNNFPPEFLLPQQGFCNCNYLPTANVPCLTNDVLLSPPGFSNCNDISPANSPCIPYDLTLSPLGYFGCNNLPLRLGPQGFSECYNLPLENVPVTCNDQCFSVQGCQPGQWNNLCQKNSCVTNEVSPIQSGFSECNLPLPSIPNFSNELVNNCGTFVNLPSPKFPSANKKVSITSIMRPNCNTPKECVSTSINEVIPSTQFYQGSCEPALSSPQSFQGSCGTVALSPLCFQSPCEALATSPICYQGLCDSLCVNSFSPSPELLPFGVTVLPGPCECYAGLQDTQSQATCACFTGLPEVQYQPQGLSECFTRLPESQVLSGCCFNYPEIQPLPQVSYQAPIIPEYVYNDPNCATSWSDFVNAPGISYQGCANTENQCVNSYQYSPCSEINVPVVYQAPVTYIETPSFKESSCVNQEIAPINVNLELSQPSCASQLIPTCAQECCISVPSFPDLSFNCYYDYPVELSLSNNNKGCSQYEAGCSCSTNQAGPGCSPYEAEVLIPSCIPAQLVIDPECLPNAYLSIDSSYFGY